MDVSDLYNQIDQIEIVLYKMKPFCKALKTVYTLKGDQGLNNHVL